MINRLNKPVLIKFLGFLIIIAFLVSCKSTKLVPEDEYLLDKNVITVDDGNKIEKSDLEPSIKQKPNRKTLGFFRFHLWVYNLTHSEDTSKNPPKWIRKIGNVVGEPPIIHEASLRYKSRKNIINYLYRKGYYQAELKDTLIVYDKNKRKARMEYHVKTGKAYKVKNIKYDITDPFVKEIILTDSSNSLINEGMIFDKEKLQKERERLVSLLKNKGYYYFNKNNIHYYADTSDVNFSVDLKLTIKKSFDADRYFIEEIFTKQKIKKVFFYVNFNKSKYAAEKEEYLKTLDTVRMGDYYFLIDGKMKLNKDVFIQANYIKRGATYSEENVKLTQKHLSSLKQFRSIEIVFRKSDGFVKEVWNAENPWLDAHIYLTPELRHDYQIEGEGTNSSGNYGVAGLITYNNRNLLGGAETFSTKLKGSLQSMVVDEDMDKRLLNTFEYGAEFKIDVPKLMIPWQNEKFIKEHDPETNFSLSFNHQNRPDYTRTLGNASFGYTWSSKDDYFKHNIYPIQYYTVKIFDFDPEFKQQIENLYIRYSFQNQLITAFSYGFDFNNQDINKSKDYWFISTDFETSGNLFRSMGETLDLEQNEANAYSLFDLEFAQYIKLDADIRYYHELNRRNRLAYRLYLGAGIPYGNSTQGLPFVKKYYIGGANDIRAWQVRTLGPGSYSGGSLYNQIADMKLLANAEYRFKLIAMVEGAFFLDAGNIWAIDPSDDREGARFKFNRFYNEIALGSGLGLRLDLNFLIVRFDFGVPLYDPKYEPENRWLGTFQNFEMSDFTINFGIGYPF